MNRRAALARIAALTFAAGFPGRTGGTTFLAPPADVDVVGRVRTVRAGSVESLVDVARRHRIGQDAMRRANPALPRWLPLAGQAVTLPTRHVLPAAERAGLVVNLAERRLYDYTMMPGTGSPNAFAGARPRIGSFPVSIGRVDWATPLGDARVIARREDPDWTPPASIRAEAAARGRTLPAVVPAGEDNPLGRHALYLDLPGYLLHGTNDPDAIGLRVTHGCVRLYPLDIAALFRRVPNGTRVRFVDEPIKVGWHAGTLYLEVHPPHEERGAGSYDGALDEAFSLVSRAVGERAGIRVGALAVRRAVAARSGLPVIIAPPADG